MLWSLNINRFPLVLYCLVHLENPHTWLSSVPSTLPPKLRGEAVDHYAHLSYSTFIRCLQKMRDGVPQSQVITQLFAQHHVITFIHSFIFMFTFCWRAPNLDISPSIPSFLYWQTCGNEKLLHQVSISFFFPPCRQVKKLQVWQTPTWPQTLIHPEWTPAT